jgi:hypothetical protein
MKNKLLGYVSAVILILAGSLEFTINNILIGSLFVLSGIGGIIIQIVFSKKSKQNN